MPYTKATFKTKLALLITILLWASAFPGIRAGLVGYSPGGMALLRFLVAATCLLVIYFFNKHERAIPFKDALLLLLIGAVTIGGYHIALNYGELTVPSGVASFVVSLMPVVTVCFAALFLNETINKFVMLGVTISVFGVGLMAFPGGGQMHFGIGFIYVLFSAFLGGVYTVLQKPFLKKYSAIDVTSFIMWGATLFLLIFIPNLLQDLKFAPLNATLATVYLGIFPAAIAYALWTYALAEIPASRAAIAMYFLPLIATFMGWVWLKEMPTFMSIIGGVTILLGVYIVNKSYQAIHRAEIKKLETNLSSA
jgi:drug/metabolite transporter (DMT)-like permease